MFHMKSDYLIFEATKSLKISLYETKDSRTKMAQHYLYDAIIEYCIYFVYMNGLYEISPFV